MLNKKNFMKICTASRYSRPMLSEASGIKESTLRSYIDNRVDILSDRLIKLADALGCTTDYLLGRCEETDLSYENEIRKKERPQGLFFYALVYIVFSQIYDVDYSSQLYSPEREERSHI